MAKKKTTLRGKAWRFAGEALSPMTISDAEERLLTDIFSDFQTLIMAESKLGIHSGNMRGRETVIKACLGYFCEQFEAEYGRESITKALTTAVALPLSPEYYAPESNSILFGAVLWLLDYVESQNLQSELRALLPEQTPEINFSIPTAEDFRYSQDLIRRVMSVLFNRKTASLREFRKMMGLIRKDDAVKLRGAFRDVLLDYFKRFLEIRKRVAPSLSPFAPPEISHALTPLPSAKDLFATGKERTPPPSLRDIPERTPDIAFLIKTPSLIGLPPEKMQSELYYRRMTDLLSEFTVQNPYEICAASVLLERENDLLMDLNTLTTATLACAERYLPWSIPYYGKIPPLCERTPPEHTLLYPFRKPSDVGEELSEDEIPEGELLSVEQIFYMATNCLLPRDRRPSGELNAWFREQGLSEEQSQELSMAAMAFSLTEDVRVDAAEGIGKAVGEGLSSEARDDRQESDDAERLAELARQLKSAKQAAHDKEQTIRQLEEQLRDEQRRAEQDRMELRGLRDTLFRTRAGEIPEFAAVENQIHFPWQIRRRVLIFGGHDTWSKSIRPLLPGARFFQRESLPDLNAIKGADVVWIQANALSHKFYYRIIETARRENILVRYFGFASARKCAEQVVENELSEASDP